MCLPLAKILLDLKKIINITKAKFVVSTINGTSALHIALKVVGVEPNDEVFGSLTKFYSPC